MFGLALVVECGIEEVGGGMMLLRVLCVSFVMVGLEPWGEVGCEHCSMKCVQLIRCRLAIAFCSHTNK